MGKRREISTLQGGSNNGRCIVEVAVKRSSAVVETVACNVECLFVGRENGSSYREIRS